MNMKYNFEQDTFCYCIFVLSWKTPDLLLIIKTFLSFRNKNVPDLQFFSIKQEFDLINIYFLKQCFISKNFMN